LSSADISNCRLYGILDLAYVNRSAVISVALQMVAGGVQVIQLRAKSHGRDEIEHIAADILPVIRDAGIPLIVNDHSEIVAAMEIAGVHVGQDDQSISDARRSAARPCIVGRSTHSIGQATQAAEEGADYIGFGPLYATPTKPAYTPIGLHDIGRVHAAVRIPIFCIGGVNLDNLPAVIAAGARRVVIVSRLLCAPDIAAYARAARTLLDAASLN